MIESLNEGPICAWEECGGGVLLLLRWLLMGFADFVGCVSEFLLGISDSSIESDIVSFVLPVRTGSISPRGKVRLQWCIP